MKLSVIVPIWCVTPDLVKYAATMVRSLFENTDEEMELIVIDNNGGRDEAAAWIERLCEKHSVPLVMIINPQNTGVGAAWNDGLGVAEGELIAILNADLVLEKDWLPPLTKALARDDIAFAAPKGKSNPGSCFIGKRVTYELLKEDGHYFDPIFQPFYFEEMDMFARATDRGLSVGLCRDSLVTHYTSAFTNVISQQTRTKVWNRTKRAYDNKHGKGKEISYEVVS